MNTIRWIIQPGVDEEFPLGIPIIAGGDGEGEGAGTGVAESSPAVGEGESGDADPGKTSDGDAKSDDQVPWNKDSRFQQFLRDRKEIADLGGVEEIRKKLARQSLQEKQETQRREKADAADPNRKVKDQMENVIPGLRRLPAIIEREEEAVRQRASDHLHGLLQGITKSEVAQEIRTDVENHMISMMTNEQYDRLLEGDRRVVDEVFEAAKETRAFKALLGTTSLSTPPPPPPPPLRHGPGGTLPKAGEKVKTFDEADKIAWGRMQKT